MCRKSASTNLSILSNTNCGLPEGVCFLITTFSQKPEAVVQSREAETQNETTGVNAHCQSTLICLVCVEVPDFEFIFADHLSTAGPARERRAGHTLATGAETRRNPSDLQGSWCEWRQHGGREAEAGTNPERLQVPKGFRLPTNLLCAECGILRGERPSTLLVVLEPPCGPLQK